MRRWSITVWLGLWGACASAKTGGGPTVGKPDPVPAAALPPEGWVTLDERGAYGPFVVAHIDVLANGTARCFKRHAKNGDLRRTLPMTEQDKTALNQALATSATLNAQPVARAGTVTDLGVTTLSVRDEAGGVVAHVIDGRTTVEPAQGEVMALLSAWLLRCSEQP